MLNIRFMQFQPFLYYQIALHAIRPHDDRAWLTGIDDIISHTEYVREFCRYAL